MSSKPWFVYIIRCADDTLYVGISNDVDRRIQKHNLGNGAKYTRGRLPIKLLYQEKYEDKSIATKREIEIKSWPKQKKLKLINSK